MAMSSDTKPTEQPFPVPGPNDPPVDLSREEAAYAKEEQRLVRDQLGWIALIRGDEVVGAFPTADEASVVRSTSRAAIFCYGLRTRSLAKRIVRPVSDALEPAIVAFQLSLLRVAGQAAREKE
jgi:hypothetical protein